MNKVCSLSEQPEFPKLVLLHGWGMNSGVWQELCDLLAKHLECLCIDLPGYGDANKVKVSASDYSLSFLANWVESRIPDNSIVLGWSLGGLVAQQIAINGSPKLKALICIASTPKFEQGDEWPGIKPEILELFHKQLSDDHAKTLNRFLAIQMQGIADVSARKQAIRSLSQRLLAKPSPNPKLLDAGLDLLSSADLRKEIAQINVPTLRVYGRLDSLIPHKAIDLIGELQPSSVSVVHKNASHAPFVTNCEQIKTDIVDFLAKSQLLNSIE